MIGNNAHTASEQPAFKDKLPVFNDFTIKVYNEIHGVNYTNEDWQEMYKIAQLVRAVQKYFPNITKG